MANPVIAFAEKHPVPVGVGVVVVGLGLLWLMSSGSASGGDASNAAAGGDPAAAYFAAASAQAQAGDAVQIAQIEGQSATTQTLLNDQASIANATTWSGAQTTQAAGVNATQIALAPFAVQEGAVTALGTAVQAPPVTQTTTTGGSSNSGFFGLFGSSSGPSTSTSVFPNPVATSAVNNLDTYLNGFAPGH